MQNSIRQTLNVEYSSQNLRFKFFLWGIETNHYKHFNSLSKASQYKALT